MSRLVRVIWLVVLVASGGGAMAQGQDAVPAAAPAQITVAEIEAAQADLEAGELDDTARSAAAARYALALELLNSAQEWIGRKASFERLTEEAPARLASMQAELAVPAEAVAVSAPEDATAADLEQLLATATAELEALRGRRAALQTETTKRNERRTEIPKAIADARLRLAQAEDALLTGDVGTGAAAASRRAFDLAQRQASEAEIAALEAELASYDARRDNLAVERDLAGRRETEAAKTAEAWQALLGARRSEEAERAARVAQDRRREVARKHPVLQEFATESERLVAQRTGGQGLSAKITAAEAKSAAVSARLSTLDTQFLTIRQSIKTSGLNGPTGMLLRRQRENVPDIGALRRDLRRLGRELEDTEYSQIDLQNKRLAAGDVDSVVQGVLAEIEAQGPVENRAELEAAARDLAIARRDLLDKLIADTEGYLDRLVKLDEVTRKLLDDGSTYEAFIEEHIFWVRSIRPHERWIGQGQVIDAARLLLDPVAWGTGLTVTVDNLRSNTAPVLAAALIFGLIFLLTRRARRVLPDLAQAVARYRTDRMRHTFRAMVLTVFLALPLPYVLWCTGWALRAPVDQVDVVRAAGAGIQAAAGVLFVVWLIRAGLRRNGLAEIHFRWPVPTIKVVRRNLRWAAPIGVTLYGIVVAVEATGDEVAEASLGRVAFTCWMVLLLVFFHRVVRPSGTVLKEYFARNRNGWLERLRRLWYPLLMAVPISAIVATWMGYYYTALQVQKRVDFTVVLALGLTVVHALLLRWLFITRRRVAVEDARRRRDHALAEAAERSKSETPIEPTPETPALDEDRLDLPAISARTQQLFQSIVALAFIVGLLAVWAEVLPALRMLDRAQIWPKIAFLDTPTTVDDKMTAIMASPATDEAAAPDATTSGLSLTRGLPSPAVSSTDAAPDEAISVTLADIGLAIIILLATLAAVKNLPGLIEIVVLQRLPMDAGSRYALSTILRYVLGIVGIVLAFAAIDISWSNVQWLAAALTFGLAFGLQEIFANFVSGLILLGERPFRVGDTVTVNTITGTVARIRMRATTITGWDRKELVIPNKSFITGEVVNWTLSDPVLRVTIPVGVSYGSDVDLVEKLLYRVARENPIVLDEPPPQVIFQDFGDSTLDHELRVFIPRIDCFFQVRHALHQAIVKTFREHDVEIAFPQRDLHVRSLGELGGLVEKRESIEDVV